MNAAQIHANQLKDYTKESPGTMHTDLYPRKHSPQHIINGSNMLVKLHWSQIFYLNWDVLLLMLVK